MGLVVGIDLGIKSDHDAIIIDLPPLMCPHPELGCGC
jgi:hypothetical protein